MNKNKPVIQIYIDSDKDSFIKEICAGIEEEGVLYERQEKVGLELDAICETATTDSILGVGIGLKGSKVAVQMTPLGKGDYLFEIENPSLKQCRILGMNAARAVKRMPFKQE